MHSRQTRNRKFRRSTFKYLLPLLVAITDVSTNVSFGTEYCVSGSYIVGIGTDSATTPYDTENATVGGYVYVNKSVNATPAQSTKLMFYLRNTKAGTTSAKHPDSMSKAIWATILTAYTNESKISLDDSRGTCSYPRGMYFDGITINK
jgi:hypothetical protein